MGKTTALVAVFLVAASCHGSCSASSDEQGVEKLWALDALPSFRITLDDRAIKKLKKKPRKFVKGSMRYDEEIYWKVGIRLKGHRSMRPIDDKPSFKIKFDKYDKSGRFLGMRSLTLNNMIEDPTMLREILGYRLYRAMGVPAPNVAYAEVSVNGKPYGLYAIIEAIDETFLEHNFEDATGPLYEGEYGCDLFPEDVTGFEHDAGEDRRDQLAELAVQATGPASELFGEKSLLQKDKVLAYLAVSAFLGDFDGYRHSHNYRIYRDPRTGLWSFLPWGIDRVMKKHLSIYDSQGLIAKRCFADAACRLDFLRTMERVIVEFERLKLEEGARAIATYVHSAMLADPRKPHSDAAIGNARAKLLDFIAKRPQRVRDEMTCLTADGEVDPDGDGYGCMDCQPTNPDIHPGAAEVCDGIDNNCSGLVDDAPQCGCPTALVDGVQFTLCDLPKPWVEAAAHCRSLGLELARIDSAEQSRKLYKLARKHRKDRWWIGLNDRAHEGRFVWSDGSEPKVTFWSKNQPDNDSCNQDCTALKDRSGGRWHDTHCGQHRPFVCRGL